MSTHNLKQIRRTVVLSSGVIGATVIFLASSLGCGDARSAAPSLNDVKLALDAYDTAVQSQLSAKQVQDSLEKICSLGASRIDAGLPDTEGKLLSSIKQDALRLQVMQSIYSRLENTGSAALSVSCERIMDLRPDDACASLAADYLLRTLERISGNAFETRCDGMLKTAKAGGIQRVALLHSHDYWLKKGDPKVAALYGLEFWARYPAKVDALGLKPSFLGTLQQAGYELECDIMSAGKDSKERAAIVFQSLQTGWLHESKQGGPSENDWVRPYRDLTPNTAELRRILQERQAHSPASDEVLFLARVARLSISHEDAGIVMDSLQAYIEELEAWNAQATEPKEAVLWLLLEANRCIYASAQKLQVYPEYAMQGNKSSEIGAYLTRELRFSSLRSRLCACHVALSERIASEESADSPSKAFATMSAAVGFATMARQPMAVVSGYRWMIENIHDSAMRTQCMFELAAYYESTLDSFSEAITLYRTLASEKSEPSLSEWARVKAIDLLYHHDRVVDAAEDAWAYLSDFPKGQYRQQATFLLALSEESLGSTEEAAELMTKIRDAGIADLRVRALVWLTKHYAESGDEGKAQAARSELTETELKSPIAATLLRQYSSSSTQDSPL